MSEWWLFTCIWVMTVHLYLSDDCSLVSEWWLFTCWEYWLRLFFCIFRYSLILVMYLSYLSWPNYCLSRTLITVNSSGVTRNTYFFPWSFVSLFYKISDYCLHGHLISHTNIPSFLWLCVNVEDRSVCTSVIINKNVDNRIWFRLYFIVCHAGIWKFFYI